MNHSLTLSDEFVLLSLDKELHRFKINFRIYQELYIIGSVFVELLLRGCIELDKKGKVRAQNKEETGVEYLDKMLKLVKEASKPRKLKGWIKYFYYRKRRRRNIHQAVLHRLQSNGLVHTVEDKVLGIIPNHRLKADEKEKKIVIERLRAELLEDGNVADQTIALCFLLLKAKLIRSYFSKNEEREMNAKVKQLQNENPDQYGWAKSVQKAINDIDAALASTFSAPITP